MNTTAQPEFWMRGPIKDIPALLQPVAHALLQAQEEVSNLLNNFPEALLWEMPAGLTSPAFHVQHIAGVISRLFTYAEGKQLSQEQLKYLSEEGLQQEYLNTAFLLQNLQLQIEQALQQLKNTDEQSLTQFRGVGRRQLPSTVMGLLFHAAEHTMRHTGQLLVTIRILKEKFSAMQ